MSRSALVPFDSEHLARVRSWILDPTIRELLGTIAPPSDVQHRRWFDELQADPRRHTFLVQELSTGELVGIVGLMDVDPIYRSSELWLYVGVEQHRGSGIGRGAVDAMLAFAFDTLGLERVAVRVMEYNAGALRFFKACGFSEEGRLRHAVFKRGVFHDVHLLSILSSEFQVHRERGVQAPG